MKTKIKRSKLARQTIRPQPGPQEQFLASVADIVFYGGAAGGGKSFGLLMEPLRHVTTNSEFYTVIFRRNTIQIRNPGGLWDEAMKLYPWAGGRPINHVLEWRWSQGGKIRMAHLEHENSVLDWQGAQITLIMFDELTHFTESQFFYMLSRNRSMCGVRPYIRGTTNPDADSWVARFIAWWINEDGSPVEERSGVVRWFIRLSDTILWADSAEELIRDYGPEVRPKSFTFIRARLEDNPALLKADPGYRANLMALSRVERERLLGGNWKVRPSAGMYFKRHEITLVDLIPDDIVKLVRYWDLAATEPGEDNPDPDWTAGVLMGLRKNDRYIILDIIHCRKKSGSVRELVLRTAGNDSRQIKIGLPQDPGQAGKDQVESYVSLLAGFSVETVRETGDKVTRADPFAAQWQNNNVDILRAPWNNGYFDELEAFPSKAHDDRVDASSGAFRMLTGNSIAVWSKLGKK